MQRSATLRRDDIGLPLPCCTRDADLFFAESPADVEYAKALCRACPIRRECLNEALQRREPWGVWGGELLVNGTIVARKRTRGRPRKSRDQEDTGHHKSRTADDETNDGPDSADDVDAKEGGYGAAIAMIPYLLISLRVC
jgi:WhiB family redox-sensing transcriptional regulator